MPSKLASVYESAIGLSDSLLPDVAFEILLDLKQLDPKTDRSLFLRRSYCQNGSATLCVNDRAGVPAVQSKLNEAWTYLAQRSYIVRSVSSDHYDVYVVSSSGREVDDRELFDRGAMVHTFPESSLHQAIVAETRHSYLQGKNYNAVFDAARLVEDSIRKKCRIARRHYGPKLMTMAFHPETGLLSDLTEEVSEREGLQALALGLVKRFRNQTGHTRPDISAIETIQALHLASYLMTLISERPLNELVLSPAEKYKS